MCLEKQSSFRGGRRNKFFPQDSEEMGSPIEVEAEKPDASVTTYLLKYVMDERPASSGWLSDPDVPTSREIGHIVDGRLITGDDNLDIPTNKVVGAWKDKEKYLEAHYALMRQDAILPLRNVVDEFRANPSMVEKESKENTRIYENVSTCDRSRRSDT